MDARGGVIYFAANAPGEALRRLYAVDIGSGLVRGNPVITSADGLDTSPILLAFAPPGRPGGSGKEVISGEAERLAGEGGTP